VPEGDTIYRAAQALRIALVGKSIVRFDAPRHAGPTPNVGAVVEAVETHGKHMEMVFDDGLVLHTHMRMTGSWHLYRPGEAWRKSAYHVRALVDVADWIAVCFDAPVVEIYRLRDRRRHPGMGALGPDLCQDDADIDECVDRMDALEDGDAPLHEVLLDQRIACGVGNVYKCEVLFACAQNPFRKVGTLSRAERHELIETASRQLRANLHRSGRITTTAAVSGGLAVYGRHGKPCVRCGTPITSRRAGDQARITYWCPSCQAVPVPSIR
jgi:endonuclease VIII